MRCLLILALMTFLSAQASFASMAPPPGCAAMGGVLDTYPPTSKEPLRAVVLVVHGFNLKPDKLKTLIDVMSGRGAYVIRLTLTGHDGNFGALERVTRDGWLRDMACATREAYETSKRLKLPLDFVGISLGALLNADFENNATEPYYAKRVYLAPAIRLHWYTRWLKALDTLPFNVNVPSFAPSDYRVYDRLPMAAYNAVFESADAVSEIKETNLKIPTLIYASSCDELVDSQAIADIIKQHPHSLWRLKQIQNDAAELSPHYCHNLVDPVSIGSAEWAQFTVGLIDYLGLVPDVDDDESKEDDDY